MRRLLRLLVIPAVIGALGACDLTGVGGEPGRVVLELVIADPPGELGVEKVRVRITAPDFDEDRWYELEIDGDSASGRLSCEAGSDRLVEVDIYSDGVISFTAAGTVDLDPGETETLTLTAESVYSDYIKVTGRIGSFGSRDHHLDSPSDVVTTDGNLYVVDPIARKLKAYSPDDLEGQPLWVQDLSFMDEYTDDPYAPMTIVYFPELGDLLLADPTDGRLDAFDPVDGGYAGEFSIPSGLTEPADMLYWPTAGSIFVIDVDGSELYLLDSSGNPHPGSRTLYDEYGRVVLDPLGLAFIGSSENSAYLAVTDDESGNFYLYTYTLDEGPFCTGSGSGGDLQQPVGIACAEGFLYVADATAQMLKIFDTEGGFVDD
ncbi:hypothetical protein KAU45_06045, partial [bacterium]|nr:hypothetical protein [bacterium]